MSTMAQLQNFVARGNAAEAAIDKIITGTDLLSREESEELIDLEAIITGGFETFVNVGEALARIRDSRLYRSQYRTFEEYVRQRWGMTGRQAHRLVAGAEIATNLLAPSGSAQESDKPPKNESQVRPLKGLEPAEQREVWQEAVQTAPAGQVTAKHVEQTRERLHPKSRPEPKEIEVPMSRVDRGGDIDSTNCNHLLTVSRGGKPQELKNVFDHDDDIWVVSLGHFGGTPQNRIITQEAHRLIPENSLYKGPPDGKFFAEGRTVLWRGSRMRLGPMVLFRGKEEPPALEVQAQLNPEPDTLRIRMGAEQLIKDVVALHELAEESYSTRQLMHLSIALTHLKNFRNSVEQGCDTRPKDLPQKGARAQSVAAARPDQPKRKLRRSDLSPGRAGSEGLSGKSISVAAERFVIHRDGVGPEPGRHFFLTENGGWTPHVGKAQQFRNATEAKMRLGRRAGELMKLTRARKL